MNDEKTLLRELGQLRRQAQTNPSNWVFCRIAELEGLLAAVREQTAWETAGTLISGLRSGGK